MKKTNHKNAVIVFLNVSFKFQIDYYYSSDGRGVRREHQISQVNRRWKGETCGIFLLEDFSVRVL